MAYEDAPLVDNFNRADEGPPPSANWATLAFGAGGLAVVSNQVAATSGDGTAYWASDDFGPDVDAFAASVTLADTNDGVSVYSRLSNVGSGTTDGYCSQVVKTSSGSDVKLFRIDNDVHTQLATTYQLIGSMDGFGIKVVEDRISAYLFNSALGTGWLGGYQVGDATYAGSGKIALRLVTTVGNVRADNFSCSGFTDTGSERSSGTVVVGP